MSMMGSRGGSNRKYHVSSNGDVNRCTAKGDCPLSNEDGTPYEHFTNINAANAHAENIFQNQYGVITNRHGNIEAVRSYTHTMNNSESVASQVYAESDVEARGFNYECYAASEYAASMGLETAIVINDDGIKVINGELDNPEEIVKDINERLINYHDGEGNPNPSRIIYTSADSDNFVVQMGSPNMLDAAIITKDNIDIAEIKKGHEEGAQLKQEQLELNEEGFVQGRSDWPEIQRAISKVNIEDTMGKNVTLDVDNIVALEHFIKRYQDAGATKFIYTNAEEKATFVDLTGDEMLIALDLNSQGIKVDLVLRSNLTERKLSDDDVKRIKNTNSKFFKSGVTPTSDFRWGDIDTTKVTSRKDKVQIGELTLPIDYDDRVKMKDDDIIKFDDLKISPVVLTGVIKST